jgi:EmrB/QacA subfamily drug resistance transporter
MRWLVLAVTVTAQFMVVLDAAVVNVALPVIGRDLRFAPENLQWVVTAYSIVFGGMLLLGGRLADILGRRRLFIAGVALFGLGSLLCGFSWSAGMLIAFRAVQGFGGALLSPAGLSIVVTTFTESRERNLALGIWGAASGGGGAAGVLFGGVLTSYAGWPWIFFVNLPVGVAVLAAAPLLLRESRATLLRRRFDVAGASSITAGLMLFVYGITRASQHGWTKSSTLGPLVAAIALMLAFVAIELRSRAPLLPLGIFRLRTLSVANATMLSVSAVAFAQFFLLTLYLQEALGYTAIRTGLAFAAITVTVAVCSNVAEALVTRLGVRRVVTVGMLLSAAAVALFARLPLRGHYFQDVFPGLVVSGIGLALAFVAATIAALEGVHADQAGVASGLINTTRQIGGSLGVAAVTAIAATSMGGLFQQRPTLSARAALVHGSALAFDTLTGVALGGALLAAAFVAPRSRKTKAAARAAAEHEQIVLDEAA